MTDSTELLVLNSTKTGERSLVLHCLSPDWARRSFITSVSRSGSMAMCSPLSILSAEIISNPKSDLHRVRNLSPLHPLHSLRSSAAKGAMAMFMSEVLFRSLREGEGDAALYDWCKRSVLTLDALESGFSNFHLRFLLEYAVALGFAPSLEALEPFAGELYKDLSALLNAEIGEFLLYPLSGSKRSAIAECLIKYLSYHLDYPLHIRSLAVLGELY